MPAAASRSTIANVAARRVPSAVARPMRGQVAVCVQEVQCGELGQGEVLVARLGGGARATLVRRWDRSQATCLVASAGMTCSPPLSSTRGAAPLAAEARPVNAGPAGARGLSRGDPPEGVVAVTRPLGFTPSRADADGGEELLQDARSVQWFRGSMAQRRVAQRAKKARASFHHILPVQLSVRSALRDSWPSAPRYSSGLNRPPDAWSVRQHPGPT
jgi:hypothetical protein